MSPSPSDVADDDLVRFRRIVAQRLGLAYDTTRDDVLRGTLVRRSARYGSAAAYVSFLAGTDPARDPAVAREVAALAPELTVGETYFFRAAPQLATFSECVRSATSKLRVLSAACSSGEEAYTLVMIARDQRPDLEIDVVGIDLNEAVLEKARAARYSAWALRETSATARTRWFRTDGTAFVVAPEICQRVRFEAKNFADEDDPFWRQGVFDVVFCRNVLMYLTTDVVRSVVARIARALVPGGLLFLGHAENLRGLSDDFDLVSANGAFHYRRRERLGEAPARTSEHLERAMPTVAPPETWLESILRSGDRIRQLTGEPTPEPALASGPGTETEAQHAKQVTAVMVAEIAHLVEEERYDVARDRLSNLPVEDASLPEVVLLRAILLTHGGQLDLAESLCTELIHSRASAAATEAGAHYLLGLGRETLGDSERAIVHHRAALGLDADFAMPQLHLGLLARKTQDRALARRELTRALYLIEHDDGKRLSLFGGGFGRAALLALCRAELAST